MALTLITPDVIDISKTSVALINDTTAGGIKDYIDTPLTTPPLFNNSVAAATTEFVQRNGLSYPKLSGVDISADIVLTTAHTGSWLSVNVANVNITLPPISTTGIVGATYTIVARHNCTLISTGADLILNASGTNTSTRALLAGETVTLVANGSIGWAVVANGVGTDSVTNNPAANGYQILSGGTIVQWGNGITGSTTGTATVTFPIAFPTACLSIVGSQLGTSGGVFLVSAQPTPLTAFTCTVSTLALAGYTTNNPPVGLVTHPPVPAGTVAARQFYWMAIGH